jgi:type II secretory pathway pseudopilin PulG
METRYPEAGFSLFELIVAMGLATTLAAVIVASFVTSHGLANRSTTVLQAHEDYRFNLEAVAGVMRDAVYSTLSNFDEDGTTAEPSFQRAVGIDENGLVLEDTSVISWRATAEKVAGVDQPGELVLTRGSEQTVLARRVPAGGFRVARLGRMLRIEMTTYRGGPDHMLETISGQTSLLVRN